MVGQENGSHPLALGLYGVRRQADAQRAPPGGPDDRSAASAGGGSVMVLRRAMKGAHAGREFRGCSMLAKSKCGSIREVE